MGSRGLSIALSVLSLMGLYANVVCATCPATPRSLCRLGAKNTLRVVDASPDSGDRLLWKWGKGVAPSATDFGTPTAATALSVCVYAADALVASLDLPAGGTCGGSPCWSAGSNGFTYADAGGSHAGVQTVKLQAGKHGSLAVSAKGANLPLPSLPLPTPLTIQLLRTDSDICFETILTTVTRNDAGQVRGRLALSSTSPLPALGSAGCGTPLAGYTAGTSTVDTLVHDALTRSFRVFVPSSYDASVPTPVVFLLHGGFGSGAQVENSSNLLVVAQAQGFIVVSPDGVLSPGNIRTWNGGGCCGYSQAAAIDDVGFVGAMIDRLEGAVCVDRRRIYATGMSNGAIMSHRLACDLSHRIRAVGSVAGAMMAMPCVPDRPVPVLEIHGTNDLHVPYAGGVGCGAAGVAFPAVAATVGGWLTRDACTPASVPTFTQGDGTCVRKGKCPAAADVVQCDIPNGGHQWPGGDPPIAGLPGCSSGYQSQSFSADDALWDFFRQHPPR